MNRKLLYVTHGYPGDLFSEKVFVDNELPALRQYFSEIVLMPSDVFPRNLRYFHNLPEGCSVAWNLVDDKVFHSRWRRLPYIFHPFVLRSLAQMAGEAKSPRQWLKGLYQAINTVRVAGTVRKFLRANNMTPANTVLFSMWFYDPAAALGRLALTDGYAVATHAHAGDMYDHRMLFRSRKLRSIILQGYRNVLTISQRGCDYMRTRYPEAARKIICRHLGSTRHYTPNFKTNPANNDIISFVTAARFDPIKRLGLIVDVLDALARALPQKQISWTVIGDGPERRVLEKRIADVKTPNLKITLTGALPNDEIQKLYSTAGFDWFLMMSRSEGIPVSMAEAMSYGIPIITTDVGDIKELATQDTALILPADMDNLAHYASILSPVVGDRNIRDTKARNALKRWESGFDASKLSAQTAALLASYIPD